MHYSICFKKKWHAVFTLQKHFTNKPHKMNSCMGHCGRATWLGCVSFLNKVFWMPSSPGKPRTEPCPTPTQKPDFFQSEWLSFRSQEPLWSLQLLFSQFLKYIYVDFLFMLFQCEITSLRKWILLRGYAFCDLENSCERKLSGKINYYLQLTHRHRRRINQSAQVWFCGPSFDCLMLLQGRHAVPRKVATKGCLKGRN